MATQLWEASALGRAAWRTRTLPARLLRVGYCVSTAVNMHLQRWTTLNRQVVTARPLRGDYFGRRRDPYDATATFVLPEPSPETLQPITDMDNPFAQALPSFWSIQSDQARGGTTVAYTDLKEHSLLWSEGEEPSPVQTFSFYGELGAPSATVTPWARAEMVWLGGGLRLMPYTGLQLVCKGDGREYIITLDVDPRRTPFVPFRNWQVSVRPPADTWCVMRIPYNAFNAFMSGKKALDYAREEHPTAGTDTEFLNNCRLQKLGLAVIDPVPGPFGLHILELGAFFDAGMHRLLKENKGTGHTLYFVLSEALRQSLDKRVPPKFERTR